jgi:hypothetical protein
MNNSIPKFKDTIILDDYDYRIWHESEGCIFYKDVSIYSFTSICSLLHMLIQYDSCRGITYTNQGLQVAHVGDNNWTEFTLTDGFTIKDIMGTSITQNSLI